MTLPLQGIKFITQNVNNQDVFMPTPKQLDEAFIEAGENLSLSGNLPTPGAHTESVSESAQEIICYSI